MVNALHPKVFWTLLRKPRWYHAARKLAASWSSDAQLADSVMNVPVLRDDGAHFDSSPFYSEWWYFDASLPGDAALVLIFHLTDLIRPAAKAGSLSISLFRPYQPAWTRFTPYPRHEISALASVCDVQMGKSRCWIDSKGIYHISVNEPQFAAEIAFESLVPGWQPGDGTIDFGGPQDHFSWIVPQPRAAVAGYVHFLDSRWDIEGIGYHDHNWGTVSLIETLNAWTWGRVYTDDYTLVYADMLFSPHYSPSRCMPFLLAQGDQPLVSSFLCKNVALDSRHDFLFAPGKVREPKGWTLAWQQAEGASFELNLRTRHVLEKADLLRDHHPLVRWITGSLVAHPHYARCLADVSGKISFSGRTIEVSTGKAICEQIVLRVPDGRS